MHRVGSVRPPLASFSQICRYSTETPTKPRQLVTEWKGISIPSLTELKARQRQNASKQPLDISYLKDAPKNSLAGRLARGTDPLPKPVAQSKPISVESIKLQAQKRREARIARENQKRAEVYSQVQQPTLDASAFGKIVNTVADKSSRLGDDREVAILPKLAPWTSASSTTVRKFRAPLPGRGASRNARSSSGRDFRKGRKGELEDDFDLSQCDLNEMNILEELTSEIKGPESVSSTLVELFDVSPRLRFSSPRKPLNIPVDGDYSLYVPKPIEANFSTSVEILSPVDTASIALSHRADIAIPKRKHALSLITRATTRSVKVEART